MTDARVPNSHDDLEALLRGALRGLDMTSDVEAVPAGVTAGSLWIHDFVSADAELAATVTDTGALAAAGVRGEASVRAISFATDEREIDIEISHSDGNRRRVAGLVVPRQEGTARLVVGGHQVEAAIDDRGRFAFDGVPRGTALVTLEFEQAVIRLDAFLL